MSASVVALPLRNAAAWEPRASGGRRQCGDEVLVHGRSVGAVNIATARDCSSSSGDPEAKDYRKVGRRERR